MTTSTTPNPAGIDQLIPSVYANYGPVVVDSLEFFLAHLPPHRQAAVTAAQLALSGDVSEAQRLMCFVHESPTLHKLGQVLARNRRLDPAFRGELQQLETMEPRTEMALVTAAIADQFPGGYPADLTIAAESLAEASVAVVVPCTWQSPDGRQDGVLKILKPGIEDRLAEDFQVWSQLGDFLDDRIEHYHLPRIEYRETFDQVRDILAAEIDLAGEQDHLREAADVYGSLDGVAVPRVWPMCTSRLTAMSRLAGRKVTHVEDLRAEQRRKLAERLIATLVVHPILHVAPSALFHADAHAGNLLVDEGGTLGLLDWSLAGRLSKPAREAVAGLVLGGLAMDPGKMARSIAALALSTPNEAALRAVVEAGLGHIARGRWPALRWLVDLLDAAVQQACVRFEGNLMMFRKSLLLVEGAAADIAEDCDVDAVFAGLLLGAFAAEWPQRAMSGLFSRSPGTHVSSADLMELMWRGPQAAAGYWWRVWREAWEG